MNLFTPVEFGALALRNRIVMAPMTRSRCGEDGMPTAVPSEAPPRLARGSNHHVIPSRLRPGGGRASTPKPRQCPDQVGPSYGQGANA